MAFHLLTDFTFSILNAYSYYRFLLFIFKKENTNLCRLNMISEGKSNLSIILLEPHNVDNEI